MFGKLRGKCSHLLLVLRTLSQVSHFIRIVLHVVKPDRPPGQGCAGSVAILPLAFPRAVDELQALGPDHRLFVLGVFDHNSIAMFVRCLLKYGNKAPSLNSSGDWHCAELQDCRHDVNELHKRLCIARRWDVTWKTHDERRPDGRLET